jgi:hypothetical protein
VKPLVTALVDTYNHQRYIEQALVSVLDQGLSPSELEIVVVDDGSDDTTPEIIRQFLPRVKYLRKKNGGQASALNAAFPELCGEIVAMLDGDDWWAKGKLTTVIDDLERNPEISAVAHAFYKFYEATNELKLFGPPGTMIVNLATPEAARAAHYGWAYLPTSALTVRRKVLEHVMPIPEVLAFSADSPIAIASMAMGVRVLSQPLSYYRFHSDNLWAMSLGDPAKLQRRYEMDETMCSLLSPILLRLGVSSECISELLDPVLIGIQRYKLRTFGGSRFQTFRTEMQSFRLAYKNPSLGYRLFKYLLMAPATLALPPRRFYELRDWYAERNLGRFRDWLGRTDTTNQSRPGMYEF